MTVELRRMAIADAAVDAGYAPSEAYTDSLEASIYHAWEALLAQQYDEGYWCFEFEADCTIPAEYILLTHFMDEADEDELEAKIGVYLRSKQAEHGGWPKYYGGPFDLSCSVKAYYALKIIGDDPTAPHMVRAREAILANGGAARANVFTHITLALFNQIPWWGVPFIPVEIMLLPRWFPFHISKVSYWSRAVMVPLFVLTTLKPSAKNPRNVDIRELFTLPPEHENYFPIRSGLNRAFTWLDRFGRILEKLIPDVVREHALEKAEAWVIERLNGTHGLGAIFPAMVNAHEMLATRGYPADHPFRVQTRDAIRRLVIEKKENAYCQPCMSPVWDTALACLAIEEASEGGREPETLRGLDWLVPRQLLEAPGDWRENRPGLRGGGWPFQFGNTHYPDIDDTSAVAWAMALADADRYEEPIERAVEWIAGMQSSNGGFGAFDVDNTHYYLNEIPFADHGALLDPPTSDVTARCVALFALADDGRYTVNMQRAVAFLKEEQEADGCWFGRWGTNFIYGTWSVLSALELAGESPNQLYVKRAAEWLKGVQREDGGWGEDNATYFDESLRGQGERSTSFQTAWALLGLMAAGEAHTPAVRRGIEYLQRTQREDGDWHDPEFTSPGFPRVFYLIYHGYSKYFPLWALARYRNLTRG